MAGANLTDAGLLGAALQAFQNGKAQRQQQDYQRAQMGAMQAYKTQQAQTAADRVKYYGQHVEDQGNHLQNADALGLKKFSQTGDAAYDRAYNQLVIANGRGELSDTGLINGVQQLGRPTAANPEGIAGGTVTPGAGPNAIAANGLKGAQQDAIGVKNLTSVYNTVSGMQPQMQAPYLHGVEAGDPNVKLQIPGETVIGQQDMDFTSPVPGYQNTPFNRAASYVPPFQGDVLAPYYTPNMKDQSSIDKANEATLMMKHRLPYYDSLAALEKVKAGDQAGIDQSRRGLMDSQSQFYGARKATDDAHRPFIPSLDQARIGSLDAGAAAANARAAATAGGANGDDKFGLALNSKKASIAMQLMRATKPTVDALTQAVTPPMSESNPEAYQALQNSYKAINDQLTDHIRRRGIAPPGGPAMPHTGLSGQSTEGLTGSVTVPGGHTYDHLHPEFASGLTALMAAANKAGIPLGMTDGYRSYAQQVDAYRRKPTLAAKPGTSNHGWGTAADLAMADGSSISPRAAAWVRQNAPQFGLNVPMTGGTGHKSEPWHVELAGGGKQSRTLSTSQMMDQMASSGTDGSRTVKLGNRQFSITIHK